MGARDPAGLKGDQALWTALRHLAASSYRPEVLAQRMGLAHLSVAGVEHLARYRVLLDGDPSCGPVVELFFLGLGIEEERAQAALAPLGIPRLIDAGLLERDRGRIWATVALVPFDDLWLVADRLDGHGATSGSAVPATDLTTRLLAAFVPRRPARRVLDLGTGTGVHALLAARQGGHVAGVDVNPRALAYARFNAGLNGIENVEWLEGDLFEPVGDRLFDLVVSNPPFVISPTSDDVHRYGGRPGDALSREVVRGSAERLDEGGLAFVLCDFAHGTDERWARPLSSWVQDVGCDALFLRFSSTSPAAYALEYHDQAAYPSSAAYERSVREWVESYRELGIEQIGSALVVLRRRAGATWTQGFDLSGVPTGHVGDRIADVLAGVEHFASRDRERLLADRLRIADGQVLGQQLVRGPDGYAPGNVHVALPDFPLVGRIAAETLPVLFALDGERDLATAIDQVASNYGLDAGTLADRAVPELRELGMRGLVLPPG